VLDDNNYTAHAALIGRSIQTNPNLQKAFNPVPVAQDIHSSNGQNCFVYSGDCKNLNDNAAMSAACGSGYTVVGWDDAGCGKKNCVSRFALTKYSSLQFQRSNTPVIALREACLLSRQ
jgi:chitinase